MSGLAVKAESERLYTYADYLEWDDDKRYELIDGRVYMMSAPTSNHQDVCREISRVISNYLVGKRCKLYFAPFDVRLTPKPFGKDDTVVQPDIVVICDPKKIDRRGCVGAPDLVIEITSPSTSARDKLLKFNKYLWAGVREYWIVDPRDKTVSVHLLNENRYVTNVYGKDDTVPVATLEGCEVNLKDVFPQDRHATLKLKRG